MESQDKRLNLRPTIQCKNYWAVNACASPVCIECGALLPRIGNAQNSPPQGQFPNAETPFPTPVLPSSPLTTIKQWMLFHCLPFVIAIAVNLLIVFPTVYSNLQSQRQNEAVRQALIQTSLSRIKTFPITTDDLRHGEQQVDQMVHDRPAMAQWVRKGDVIYSWAAGKFAGESVGQRVWWNPNYLPTMPPTVNAYNNLPTPFNPGSISIREVYAAGEKKGQKIESERLWRSAVFELFNISNWDGFKAAYEEAIAGKLSKAEYIDRNTRLEFFTAINTHGFYLSVWQPWARQSGATSQEYLWHGYTPNTHEESMKQRPENSEYISFYSEEYDKLVAHIPKYRH